jgi:RHS repeat-associated protein
MIKNNADTNQQWVYHYLHDALGSVIGLVDNVGTLVERYTYDPYGKTMVESRDPLSGTYELNGAGGNSPTWSAFGNPFMWTAQRYDTTVGLYHFKYRTYNPVWGRWNQQDPLGYAAGLNLYECVSSNPLFMDDPLGLLPRGKKTDLFGTKVPDLDMIKWNAVRDAIKGYIETETGKHLSDKDKDDLASRVTDEMSNDQFKSLKKAKEKLDAAEKKLNKKNISDENKKKAEKEKSEAEAELKQIRAKIEETLRKNAEKDKELKKLIEKSDEAKKKKEEEEKKKEKDAKDKKECP